ncbi:DUF4153 domain-containing protein [Paenibacillus xanthanilyticus]|uniref:DUF4173 domain-containing protein n=1 Tax=Paenibacillus xanthanilyticus TaxID=1783531 RepID=A0ABV8K2L4_9BACL
MRDPAPWQKRYDRLLPIALLFGVFSQYALVGHAAGLSVPLLVMALYAVFFYAMKGRIGGLDQWRGQSRSGWLLFLPIALLSASYALFSNELFRALNALFIPAMLLAQAALLTRASSKPWYRAAFYADLFDISFIRTMKQGAVPFRLIRELMVRGGRREEGRGAAGQALLGLLLAVPVLIVVVLLLAAADGVFQAWLGRIPALFADAQLGEAVIRIGFALVVSLLVFCYLWGLLFPEQGPRMAQRRGGEPVDGRTVDMRLHAVTGCTLLGSVALVYVLFAALQFSYLFGAADGLLPEGTAYAAYARRGFVELVLVALINLGLLLLGLHGLKREPGALEHARRTLLGLIVGCTFVMLASAYIRLSLYEEAYGYTVTRLLVHGFMLFLAALLAFAFARIWREQISLAKAFIGLGLLSYVILNYVNLDARIASQNIARYEQSGDIDVDYLAGLSADAGPQLRKLLERHPELSGLEAALTRLREDASKEKGWQSWNWSKQRMRWE